MFAYVTLLTRDSYLMGIMCLLKSLKRVGSLYNLIVMVTPDQLSGDTMSTLSDAPGCLLHPVKPYAPQIIKRSNYKLECYAECWTKLLIWKEFHASYRRVMYLDADMVLLRNVDHLFTSLPQGFWAAPDCAFGRQTRQERDSCALFGYSSSGTTPKALYSFHTCLNNYFNAGMFVVTPSYAQFLEIERVLQDASTSTISSSWRYAEQDFLNHFFEKTWHCLSPLYNLQKGIKFHHPEMWDPENAYIVHFTDHKPWADRGHPENERFSDIVDLWWSIYDCND